METVGASRVAAIAEYQGIGRRIYQIYPLNFSSPLNFRYIFRDVMNMQW